MPDGLRGVKAPDPKDRVAATEAADLKFSHDAGTHGRVPGVIASKRKHSDELLGGIRLTEADFAKIDTIDELETVTKRLLEVHAGYFAASDVTGNNAGTATAALRKPAFFAGLAGGLEHTKIPEADREKARKLLGRMERESFLGLDHKFTIGDLDSYHPYSDPFDDGVRALRDLAPAGRARDSIESVLNYIVDRKTTRSGSSIDERNAEHSLGLRVIDRGNDGQSVSLKDSFFSDPRNPEYVVMNVATKDLPDSVPNYVVLNVVAKDAVEAHLNARVIDEASGRSVSVSGERYVLLGVQAEGLPEELAEHAGKNVVRIGDELYFDGSSERLPAALLAHVVETPVGEKLAMRPLAEGEKARDAFPIRDGIEGLPPGLVANAGRSVIRDGDELYYDGTTEKVPAALAKLVIEKPAGDITLRRAREGELQRAGFWYDRDESGAIDADERDVEASGRKAVDEATGQTLSLAAEQPEMSLSDYAGRSVYRADDKLYFDGTGTRVPKQLEGHVVEKRASRNLGLRLVESGEKLREKLPYDWNQNGGINLDKIDTSWWGHCHIKSALESLDLHAESEVTMFDAASGAQKTFTTTDINDLLFALFDADRYTSRDVERTRFIGLRNDTTGAPVPADELILNTGGMMGYFGSNTTIKVRLKEIFDDKGNALDLEEPFLPTKLEKKDGIRFVDNPNYEGYGDWSKIEAAGKVVLEVSYYDVDPDGEITRRNQDITIDRKNPPAESVLLATRTGGGYPPTITRIYYNVKKDRIEQREFKPVKADDEKDVERGLGLRLVDPDQGGQAVSLARDASPDAPTYVVLNMVDSEGLEAAFNGRLVDRNNRGQSVSRDQEGRYVIMNVAKEGVPPEHAAHAGAAVVRIGDTLVFDRSGADVPEALRAHVVTEPASNRLFLRSLQDGERARESFPVDCSKVENIPPVVAKNLGASVVRSNTGFMQFEGSGDMVPTGYANLVIEKPASANVHLRPLRKGEDARADFVYDLNADGEVARGSHENDVERTLGLRPIDTKNGGQTVSLAEDASVDRPRYVVTNIAANLPEELAEHAEHAGKAVFRSRGGQYFFDGTATRVPHALTEHIVEKPASKKIGVRRLLEGEEARYGVPVDLNQNETIGRGLYDMVPDGKIEEVGEVNSMSLRRELTKESTLEIHKEIMRTIREGISFVADTSSGHAVWNYGVTGVKVTQKERDGEFVKYEVSMTGASKRWEYIVRENSDGEAVAAHAVTAPPDFLWQPERSVAMPAFKDPDTGTESTNRLAASRGYVTWSGGKLDPDSLAFYRYAADVVYASLAEGDESMRYVIRNDKGELYFYDDEQVFNEDVATLKQP
jgi:hypothetical protein